MIEQLEVVELVNEANTEVFEQLSALKVTISLFVSVMMKMIMKWMLMAWMTRWLMLMNSLCSNSSRTEASNGWDACSSSVLFKLNCISRFSGLIMVNINYILCRYLQMFYLLSFCFYCLGNKQGVITCASCPTWI